MIRIIVVIALGVISVYGVLFVLESNNSFASLSVSTSGSVAAVAAAPSIAYDTVGTITYGRDNTTGAPVPYLVYKNELGMTETKTLSFNAESRCVTSQGTYACSLITTTLTAYYGQTFVEVAGTMTAEHVLVTRISAVAS